MPQFAHAVEVFQRRLDIVEYELARQVVTDDGVEVPREDSGAVFQGEAIAGQRRRVDLGAVLAQQHDGAADEHLQFGGGLQTVGSRQDATIGLEHTFDFRQARFNISQVIKHVICHHDVEVVIAEGQPHRIAQRQVIGGAGVIQQQVRRKIQGEIGDIRLLLNQTGVMAAAAGANIEDDFIARPVDGIQRPTDEVDAGNSVFGLRLFMYAQVSVGRVVAADRVCLVHRQSRQLSVSLFADNFTIQPNQRTASIPRPP